MVNPLAHSLKRCAAVLAAGVAAAAAEPATPPTEGALAAAKRDYQSFEQLSGVAADGVKLGDDGRSLPPLESETDAPPSLSPIQRARKAATDETEHGGAGSSKTWLIDAFDALGDKTTGQSMRLDDASLEEGSEGARTIGITAGEDQRSIQRTSAGKRGRSLDENRRAEAADKPSPATVRNPLDGYMSKWMTAKDFELLRSKSEPTGQGNSPALSTMTSRFDVVPAPRIGDEQMAPFEFTSRALGGHGPLWPRFTSENPYLEAIAPFSRQIPQVVTNEIAPLQVNPPLMPQLPQRSPIVDQVNPPPAEPLASEILKAQDDARYFKQLKRF